MVISELYQREFGDLMSPTQLLNLANTFSDIPLPNKTFV